ncbi:phenylalanine--tRNA ligase subunit beta [Hydrogenivirga sp. 128-5-R1-1]|uniref:phenylalanine--tRNA ligase subunit beta n=1 Tax=Hydrogenivirga sp. 128-5-R1-1 TaxID=392423 RepID=UPI00015F372D|nr:phenylalanine--tRNA ligase subunit beta [Hydrogenivirga sp. 128-5-R1-1]EDP76340.1 phenylalanyl-tRNA synthetase beta subunit [Hydrogenivirga sp. 128-5-R1-1]
MRVPFSWLSLFVDLGELTAEEVAERLSLQSVEAEVSVFGTELDGVVFGKVLVVRSHPKKKELNVLEVEVVRGKSVTIVTADRGVSKGEVVVVALPNSKVGDRCVTKREFDGIVSEGMLLSAQEIGLEEHSEGVLRFHEDITPGTDAGELLGFGEKLIELDITPNRGDVLSVRGLAREIGAIFGLERREPEVRSLEETGDLSISIEDGDCRRYRGVVIEGVSVKPSSLEVRKRLWQSGLRPINNVVDITNYVLLQEGQPLHAFDLDRLEGGIVVRSAREGERIRTLDGEERELDPDVLVIADREKPVAVAGVIGGLDTGVTENTRNVLLEAAYFEPARVRRSSKKLGVQTESSYRFERNVDVERVDRAEDLAVQYILDAAGGSVRAVRDLYPKKYEPKKVFLSMGKFMRYAGESYKNEEASTILSALEIPHEIKRCGIEVLVPSHRSFDISRDVDIVEELMRVKGYDHYTSEALKLPVVGRLWRDELLELKEYLRDKGITEVINISYEEEELYELLGLEKPQVEVLNPLVPTQRFMRSSLLPSLLRTAKFNENHYNYDMAIFELGKVFFKDGEENRLGILVKGVLDPLSVEEWTPYRLLGVVQGLLELRGVNFELESSNKSFLHPHVQSRILAEGEEIGFIGRLHPSMSQRFEFKGEPILCELKVDPLLERTLPHYRAVSKFPPVIRDLALIVDKHLSVSKLLNEIKSQLTEMVEDAMVFDVYAGEKVGEGKKSVGVRISFRSLRGSLSGEEVNALVDELVRRLREKLGVEMR